MAVAAFKSASKRATSSPSSSSLSSKETKNNHTPTSPTNKRNPPPRRSRSVSAVPRSHFEPSTSSSDFLIKRDNPLYWTNASPPEKDFQDSLSAKPDSSDAEANRRGRSVSRNAKDVLKDKVGAGPRRSVSRGPVSRTYFLNSESDVEQRGSSLSKFRHRNDVGRGSNSNLIRSGSSDTIQRVEILQTPTRSSSTNLACSENLSCENGYFAKTFSEAEEKRSNSFCEQMKSFQDCDLEGDASSQIYETVRSEVRRAIADIQNDLECAIRRSNTRTIASSSVTDIPPDLVNPSAVELILDIRREYAEKLEQSQERARRLRADLAIEEHRSLELRRILKEVLPDPKSSNVQKSNSRRKSSIERRRMSKRLTEEAMAYFDECVSLSTFDSSDFSSQEDPPISLLGINASVAEHALLPHATTINAANQNHHPIDRQVWGSSYIHDKPEQSATSSSKEHAPDEISLTGSEKCPDRRLQFSFASNQNNTLEFQHDIGKFAKSFRRGIEKDALDSHVVRSDCNYLDDMQASAQSLLFDTLILKNKIESGRMLLCGGGVAIMQSPFDFLL